MSANSPPSPEGSILTPNGWVSGKVEFAGHAISVIDGRTTAAGAKPKGPFVLPGFIDLHVHGGGGGDWQGGEQSDPTVLLAAYRAIPRLYAITDASAAGMPDGTFEWGGRRVIKKGQRITLENGTTLAGSAITMLDAFRNLISLGLSLEEAAEMTSVRQAEYLGLQDVGRIEPGARACLVKLDEDLRLQGVWVDGESIVPAS
jgi:N-acetylglucosamine-6-phosphate deacetylase